jgi:hypothetical protein
LVLEQQRLRSNTAHAPGADHFGQHDNHVDRQDE